ncbi:hypothetical protein VTJ49DRAFT_6618 [Mycothermus thermophilus]|uniref:Uncharacterized protein n=1 Tax=Humicola insolens TaxID=85995 RepID=A0ABR3VK79_HUMIN
MARLLSILAAIVAVTGPVCLAYPREVPASKVFLNGRQVDTEYDYIIVGGGTAGLTVADRLTEDGTTTVLVIEIGKLSNSAAITTVTGGFSGMSNPSLLFGIQSVPQRNLRNRTVAVQIGKVVGGSSAVNAMMTVRPAAEDFDIWGSFFGPNSHWSWQGLLPYFKRALNFVPPDEAVTKSANITYDTSYWGTTSGVYAGWPSFQYPSTTAQMEAFRGLPGVPFVQDSGSGQPGVYWYPTFMDPKKVERSYARTGHHDQAATRPNYHLATESKVRRIVLDGTKAAGVAFVPASAGSTATETVLSGIGPRQLLSSANIDTVVDLPGVGQNFQDHPIIQATFQYSRFNIRPNPTDLFANATFRAWSEAAWAANRSGPNSIATGNAAAWLPFPVISSRADEIASALEAQNHANYLEPNTDPTVAAGYRAQMLAYASALRSNGSAFYNLVLTGGSSNGILVDLHPLSRGTVNIDTSDPYNRPPRVDYRALANPLDSVVMAELVRFTRKYHLENPLTRDWAATELSPGRSVQTDQQFADYFARTLSPTEFHPVGTCAMMPRELGGVVDEELRVYGVEGLRVVDGSIMSTLVGGNTCQTVYAVAEKAADLIRYGAPKIVE